MNETISIIVPVYNAESTLQRCVSALIGQTHANIEIILVNDGSKDGSLEICRRYETEDSRVRVIDKPNGGVSSARNCGLDVATGAFVMFCDSDDWVEENWCETMLAHYSPENLTMCAYFCHLPDGRTEIISTDQDSFPKNQYLGLLKLGGFAPWNKIFSAEIIAENHIRFPEDISLGEDKLFIWRYLKYIDGQIVYVHSPLNHYLLAGGNSLSTSLPKEYQRQLLSLTGEIMNDIQNGAACAEEAWDCFLLHTYYQIEGALKQLLDDPKYSLRSCRRACLEFMDSRWVRVIVSNCSITQTSIIARLVRYRSFAGLYLLHLLKKL